MEAHNAESSAAFLHPRNDELHTWRNQAITLIDFGQPALWTTKADCTPARAAGSAFVLPDRVIGLSVEQPSPEAY